MESNKDNESWVEYRKLVISELDRLDAAVKSVETNLSKKLDTLHDDIRVERERITAIKAIAAFVGFLSGIIASIFGVFFSK